MNTAIPIVRKLQADAINEDISVSSLLRTAKVIATKLDLKDALVWIDRELDGYMSLSASVLPEYRQLTGQIMGFNPYHGWRPVQFGDPEHERAFSRAPVGMPVGTIEEEFRNRDGDDGLAYSMPPENKSMLVNGLDIKMDVQLQLTRSSVFGILDAVRNLILNWSLELEKAGIIGQDMEFSIDEKKEAVPVTQQFFAQNIGVVGNVTDSADVLVEQKAKLNVALDMDALKHFVEQVHQSLPHLPEDVRGDVEQRITDIENELTEDEPDQNRIRTLLGTLRTVCEGAAGNLTAQGILGLLTNLLG